MNVIDYSLMVTEELKRTLSRIDENAAENLIDLILASRKVFIAGAGRSGLMMKAFANRLMHLGLDVHVVGETTTPAIGKDDVLIIGSGSGETGSLVQMANKAKCLGAHLALVTIFTNSTIAKTADVVIKITAPTPKAMSENGCSSIQPMGNLFEQCLLLFMDCTVIRLMEKTGENAATMYTRHANLE